MDYEFLDSSIDRENLVLPNSDKINPFLLQNNREDILKALDFIASEGKFLYIHGFMGAGKRQFINYLTDFLNKDIIKLEYYCKEATVCDDILLSFIDQIESLSISKAVNLNAKITTLNVKFQQLISSIKKPFLITLHSLDDVCTENLNLISDTFYMISKEDNVKIIVSTRGMYPSILGDLSEDIKISLKALSKNVFELFIGSNQLEASGKIIEDFYNHTRGYYYYTVLSIKIIQAMNISLSEFLQKYAQSGMDFDSFLSITYLNLVPTAIRNFFWFLRTVRHGLTLNALAIYDIYDEFAIQYLKNNLMIFQVDETLFVQDYFLQKIDISIPNKTQIRLHKYIIGIYEKELKLSLKERAIMISRQAMRSEIEYHNNCIKDLENGVPKDDATEKELVEQVETVKENEKSQVTDDILSLQSKAQTLITDKKYTEAIECYSKILDTEDIDLRTLVDVRYNLSKLYKQIGEYTKSSHYFELVETFYKQHNEVINLNYLYYDMADLYFKTYKNERAVETIKKVIYSVDTPQSLMVSACTMLANIYSDMNIPEEAYNYYKKALESLDENVENNILSELYFKYALANDDKGDTNLAFEFYNKCISVGNSDYKALAYSNLASCYYENGNYDEAKACYSKAYEIDKTNNNYDGLYYNASNLAKILLQEKSKKAIDYLIEAKRSADFLNEDFYIIESSIALGDYYYNSSKTYTDALREYYKAKSVADRTSQKIDITIIEKRISDMRLRMKKEDFAEIENKYGK